MLLELGTGFNPEFTGLENIYFYCSILGYGRLQIDDIVENIIEFADIGDFIHQPLKTYSSGMKARLGFSVSVNVDPDILILDPLSSFNTSEGYLMIISCINVSLILIAPD